MKKVKEFWKVFKWALVPAGICAAFLLLDFLVKGIWPLGDKTVVAGDDEYSFIPIYTHFHDVLTGKQGMGWTPMVGAGNEAYESEMITGVFNPLTWVMFLGGRGGIIYWMSLSLILRVCFSAVTAYFCLVKLFPKNRRWLHVLLAVTYGLSGYMFKYYTNIFWVDVAGLFPLLILALKYMFETKRIMPFTIVMMLALLNSYNLVWMFLVFLGLVGFAYVFATVPGRKEKVGVILRIMGACLLAAGVTGATFLVSFLHLKESYRGEIWNQVDLFGGAYGAAKMMNVFFYSLPVLGTLLVATHVKEDRKITGLLLYGFAMTWIVPTIFEPVNLIWQGGTYQCFPMRYGFMSILIMAFMTERYFERFLEKDLEKVKWLSGKVRMWAPVLIGAAMAGFGVVMAVKINHGDPVYFENTVQWAPVGLAVVAALGVIAILLGFLKDEKVRTMIIATITLFQAGLWSFAYVGDRTHDATIYAEGIHKFIEARDDLDKSARWKDVAALGNANWGVVAGAPVVSTFFGANSKEQFEAMTDLGYQKGGSMSLEAVNGGTLASDAVLGIKYYVSQKELEEEYFTEIGETGQINYGDTESVKIYERKGFSGLGFLYDQEVMPEIFEVSEEEYGDLEQEREISFKVEGEKEVYFSAGMLFWELSLNGEKVFLPSLGNKENTKYGGSGSGEKVRLGRFKDETVTLKMTPVKIGDEDVKRMVERRDLTMKFSITQMNIDGYFEWMKELSEQPEVSVGYLPDAMKIRVEASEGDLERYGDKLFLPVTYDEGWKVVRGQDYERELGGFMSFKLEPGVNEIEMKYEVKYLKEFMKVSGVSGIVLVGVMGWEIYAWYRKNKLSRR